MISSRSMEKYIAYSFRVRVLELNKRLQSFSKREEMKKWTKSINVRLSERHTNVICVQLKRGLFVNQHFLFDKGLDPPQGSAKAKAM